MDNAKTNESGDKSQAKQVCPLDESDNEKSDTSDCESSCQGSPESKTVRANDAEISDKLPSTNEDNITQCNPSDEQNSESETCQTENKSVSHYSNVCKVQESRDLLNSDNAEGNENIVSVEHKKQKLLTKDRDSKCSSSDDSDTTYSNEEGEASESKNDSRSLTKSDIEAEVSEGKKKVLRKMKIKEEPLDSSSYSVDEVVVKQEPKEENSMSTSYEEYDPTFVVKTDWYTICTQSQAGEDRGITYFVSIPLYRPQKNPPEDMLYWLLSQSNRKLEYATSNYDDIFDCFLKQVEIDEFNKMESDDLRICLIEYCKQNIAELEERLNQNLGCRNIDMATYIQKMINRTTSGLDITAIILGHMFDLNIVALFDKYIWKSVDVNIENFHVFLIVMKGGVFASATPTAKYRISVQLPTCCRHLYVVTSDSVTDEVTKAENFKFELAKRDMPVEVGSYLPAEGWKDNPEVVDTIVTLLDRVVFTPRHDKNDLFSSIRPQLLIKKSGFLYGPRHMRRHLLMFCKENYECLEGLLSEALDARQLSLKDYMELMEGTSTSGYEVTLLILSHMFSINILVIRSDFLWLSSSMAPIDCNVVIVQSTSGEFLGTKSLKGSKVVDVGTVPRIYVNKRRSPMAVKETKTSTPIDLSRTKCNETGDKLNVSVSPITASQGNALGTVVESEFEESFELLKSGDNNTNLPVKTSLVSSTVPSTSEGRLNIRDIDNDTSTENNVDGVEVQDTNTTKSLDDKNESAITIASTTCEDILQNQNIDLSGDSTLVETDGDNVTVLDKVANNNDSTLTLTKIELKNSDLSVTVTPSSISLAHNISGEDSKQTETFFPDSEELKDMSTPNLTEMDIVTTKEESDRAQSKTTTSEAEHVTNNEQNADLMTAQPSGNNSEGSPPNEIVDDTLKVKPLNGDITDGVENPVSPPAEIGDKGDELNASDIWETSPSILPCNVAGNNEEEKAVVNKPTDVEDTTDIGGTLTGKSQIKPLVDYDDTFTDVTQPTEDDTRNENMHDDSDSDLTQEFVSLSEIPTSQLDTSIPSEFEDDSGKEETEKESDGKKVESKSVVEEKKKKRLGNTGIVKKVNVKGTEITDEKKEEDDKEITDLDETKDEMQAEEKLKGDKSSVKKKRKRTTKSRWTVAKKKKVTIQEVGQEDKSQNEEPEMEEIAAVKMGCNKCIEVFYSEGGYHEHLTARHRIKNYSKYPPTIISRLWTKIPSVPKLSEEDRKAREFQCKGCPSRFFRSSALETHEKMCYKAPVQVKENQAQLIYDMIEKQLAEKNENNETNTEAVERKSRSRTLKKDEEVPKVTRNRESRSNSENSQKQFKVSKTEAKESAEEISDKEKKLTTGKPESDEQITEETKSKTAKKTLKVSIAKLPSKSNKGYSKMEMEGKKEFTKKPLPKKYPLRSNKEVEAAEKLLAKYKTLDKKDENEEEEPSNMTSTSNSISDNIDNTDLDANYSPEDVNNSSTSSAPETPKLPIISRPRTRSMKPSEDESQQEEQSSASKNSSKKRKSQDENEENSSSHKPNKKSKQSMKTEDEKEKKENEISEEPTEDIENKTEIDDEKLEKKTGRKSRQNTKVKKNEQRNEDADNSEKEGKDNEEDKSQTEESEKPKTKAASKKRHSKTDDEDNSEKQNDEIPDKPDDSQKGGAPKKKKKITKKDEKQASEEEDDDFYKCNVCDTVFPSNEKYKEHKKKCTKVPKKHVCSKCSKGFTARSYLVQHYDYHHTNKPKKFVCKTCDRDFELEKSFKEHNQRLHNKGDYKYFCDFCGRKFWHRQEFTLHRAHHTGDKPFQCGLCGIAKFADSNRLNNHLKTCGKENSFKCGQCGGMYSDQKSLSTHVSDHHEKKERRCPICPNKIYTSEGGYYTHMRTAHQVGRNGQKLQEVMANNQENNSAEEENNADISDENGKNNPKKKNPKPKSANSSKSKSDPKREEEDKKKKNAKKEDPTKSKGTQSKPSSKSTSSGSKGSSSSKQNPKKGKGDNTKPSKLTYHCPFSTCEHLEYEEEQEYFDHLFTFHKLEGKK